MATLAWKIGVDLMVSHGPETFDLNSHHGIQTVGLLRLESDFPQSPAISRHFQRFSLTYDLQDRIVAGGLGFEPRRMAPQSRLVVASGCEGGWRTRIRT